MISGRRLWATIGGAHSLVYGEEGSHYHKIVLFFNVSDWTIRHGAVHVSIHARTGTFCPFRTSLGKTAYAIYKWSTYRFTLRLVHTACFVSVRVKRSMLYTHNRCTYKLGRHERLCLEHICLRDVEHLFACSSTVPTNRQWMQHMYLSDRRALSRLGLH